MKRVVDIIGEPLFPIKVGEKAVIHEDGGNRRTSTVIKVENISKQEIHFETNNCIYHLHRQLDKSREIAGAMLINMFKHAGY